MAREFYTLTTNDVDKTTVTAFGRTWDIFRVLPRDVGKRAYRTGPDLDTLQVENDQQRIDRVRAECGPSLYISMKAAGVPIDHHASDLYVKDIPAAHVIMSTLGVRGQRFRSNVDQEFWIDIPFGYEPFWIVNTGAAGFVGPDFGGFIRAHLKSLIASELGRADIHRLFPNDAVSMIGTDGDCYDDDAVVEVVRALYREAILRREV